MCKCINGYIKPTLNLKRTREMLENMNDLDENSQDDAVWNTSTTKKGTKDVYSRIKDRKAKRRKKEKIIKMTLAGILVLFIVVVAVKVSGDINHSDKAETSEIAAVSENEANVVGAVENETVKKKTYVYPSISSSYMEMTSTAIKSPYIALLDVEINQVVAGRGSSEKIYPASMTKVMTLIVAVENLKNLNDTFTFSNEILYPLFKENASVAGFLSGEVVDAKNLLYGLILPSGADSAVAVAQMIAGSEAEYANLMNKKCEEIGLKNTHFVNTSGLFYANQYTTPTEMAMIFQYAMANETCAKILSTYQYTTDPTPQHPQGILLTSTMFSRMYGNEVEGVTITAGKTGYVVESGNCLVSYAVKDGRHYVAVIAGGTYKWNVIFDDFEIFRNYIPAGAGAVAAQ